MTIGLIKKFSSSLQIFIYFKKEISRADIPDNNKMDYSLSGGTIS